jgi:hypothetical protein
MKWHWGVSNQCFAAMLASGARASKIGSAVGNAMAISVVERVVGRLLFVA